MKAVIYARYSSDSQREESIEGQIRDCREYAARNDITILGEYIDRALSARTADRPEFQRMIADSEKGMFDCVLVWKLDRFSRDRYDSAHYKRILKKNGVKVISAKESISDGPEGIIMEAMLEGYAEYYSAELSVKVQRGQRENAMKCKSNGGVIPIGYRVGEDGHFVIDPIMAPVVQEVFRRYDEGEMIKSIAKDLNARGLRNQRGNKFQPGSITVMLRNRRYIGEYKYGEIVVPGGMPALISNEQFERVQRRMEINHHHPGKALAEEEYLLTPKLFCGDCGRMMRGECGTSQNGTIYYYYKCAGSKLRLGCKRKSVKKKWIEWAVVYYTVNRVLNDETINRIADAMVKLQQVGDTKIPALEEQLKESEKSVTNLLNAIQAGIFTPSTKERLEQLEDQRDKLKLAIAQARLERPVYTKEQIVEWISRHKGGDIEDFAYQKQIIDTFVNSVYLYDDRLVITYNYRDGTETITKEAIDAAISSNVKNSRPPKSASERVRVFLCISMVFWVLHPETTSIVVWK